MKNTIKLFGIIALVAIIGFTMTACGDSGSGSNSGGGGGKGSVTLTLNNSSSYNITHVKVYDTTGRTIEPDSVLLYDADMSIAPGGTKTFNVSGFTFELENRETFFRIDISFDGGKANIQTGSMMRDKSTIVVRDNGHGVS